MLKQCVLCVVIFFLPGTTPEKPPNNSCKTYIDYLFLQVSKNCYHNPDLFAQTNETIERYIGSSETYNVTTEDGYILTIFRIPKKNPKGVIILQHPLTTDSVVWVGQGNQSFAFLLWNLNYDIWLPNHRGTFFSREHLTLNTKDEKYWDFSFHEIGLYDYKTIIDFVKRQTGEKVIFITHSMSTTSSLIYSSLRAEESAESVRIFVDMSPVAYLKYVRSPVTHWAAFTPLMKVLNKVLRITHFQEYDSKSMIFLRTLMLEQPFKYLLSLMISYFQGWNPREFDPALITVSVSQHPRSYPWKIFYHYVQQYVSGGRFQMYDYGSVINKKNYGTVVPPEYPLDKIITPTYLIYSKEDSIATSKDAELLYGNLNPKAKIYGKLEISGINHVDFHFGRHRIERVFNRIVDLLAKI